MKIQVMVFLSFLFLVGCESTPSEDAYIDDLEQNFTEDEEEVVSHIPHEEEDTLQLLKKSQQETKQTNLYAERGLYSEPEQIKEEPEENPAPKQKVSKQVKRRKSSGWKILKLYRTCRVRKYATTKSRTIKVQRGGVNLRVRPYNKRWVRSRSGYMHELCFR